MRDDGRERWQRWQREEVAWTFGVLAMGILFLIAERVSVIVAWTAFAVLVIVLLVVFLVWYRRNRM